MPILKRLRSYLDTNKIPYEVVNHPKAYTAHDVAQTLDVPGKLVAKVVMVKADSYFVMSVLPPTWRVYLKPAMCDWRRKRKSRICSPIVRSARCLRSAISMAWRCTSINC